MATFKRDVHVSNPETGDAAWFKPGDEVPDWAVDYVDEGNLGDPEALDGLEDYPAADQRSVGGNDENDSPVTGVPEGEGGSEASGTYGNMSNEELKDLLSERDLPVSGTKKELVNRLVSSDNGAD